MNTPEQTELLIEATASAWRPRDPRSRRIGAHPNWLDLDDEGRRAAFELTRAQRALEAALDPDGLSTTARGPRPHSRPRAVARSAPAGHRQPLVRA